MTNSLKINLTLEEVKEIVLNHCKSKFNDNKLELQVYIKKNNQNPPVIMAAYSHIKKESFYVERSVKISNDDIENIFSPVLEELGYEIADYNWIFADNGDIDLLFTVSELEKEKQKGIGGK